MYEETLCAFLSAAWKEMRENISDSYVETFRCLRCAPGCAKCDGPKPCLASYNWSFRYNGIKSMKRAPRNGFFHRKWRKLSFFRITLLTFSIFCVFGTIFLVAYTYQHRKLKVFKVASPIFLSITLLGCAIMYLEVRFRSIPYIIR